MEEKEKINEASNQIKENVSSGNDHRENTGNSNTEKVENNSSREEDTTRKNTYHSYKKRDGFGNRGSGERKGKFFNYRVKKCIFCEKKEEELKVFLNYKNYEQLKKYTSERGRILSGRITGNCNIHQRILQKEIKKARCMALLPYSKIIKLSK